MPDGPAGAQESRREQSLFVEGGEGKKEKVTAGQSLRLLESVGDKKRGRWVGGWKKSKYAAAGGHRTAKRPQKETSLEKRGKTALAEQGLGEQTAHTRFSRQNSTGTRCPAHCL